MQTNLRRRGREAEGDGLLNRYTGDCIGGSNPLVSAITTAQKLSPLSFCNFLYPLQSLYLRDQGGLYFFICLHHFFSEILNCCQFLGISLSVSPNMLNLI